MATIILCILDVIMCHNHECMHQLYLARVWNFDHMQFDTLHLLPTVHLYICTCRNESCSTSTIKLLCKYYACSHLLTAFAYILRYVVHMHWIESTSGAINRRGRQKYSFASLSGPYQTIWSIMEQDFLQCCCAYEVLRYRDLAPFIPTTRQTDRRTEPIALSLAAHMHEVKRISYNYYTARMRKG